MRRLAIALGVMVVVALAGGVGWKSDAATWTGTLNLPSAAKNYSPIEKAGCVKRGRCPLGWFWACGPYKCKCRPCY